MREGKLKKRVTKKKPVTEQFFMDELVPLEDSGFDCVNVGTRASGSFKDRGIYLAYSSSIAGIPEIVKDEAGCYVLVFRKA